jgi:hypothetical protein
VFFRPPSTPPRHDLGYWIETREEALKEAYALFNWYKNGEREGWHVLMNLAKTIDQDAQEFYIDPEYTEKYRLSSSPAS